MNQSMPQALTALPSVDEFIKAYREGVDELNAIINGFGPGDFEAIGKHNYGWVHTDFKRYLIESEIRYVNAFKMLLSKLTSNAKILDVGGFFGAFPLALRRVGFEVAIVEQYGYYGTFFLPVVELLKKSGIQIINADFCLEKKSINENFDVVLCMAVAEHLANSPATLMDNIHSALLPKGLLLFEVPNQICWINRWNLLCGRNFMPSLETICRSATPFTGHHHEYTPEDVDFLLSASGFDIVAKAFHNCYYVGLDSLRGYLTYHLIPRLFPRTRDSITALGQKR